MKHTMRMRRICKVAVSLALGLVFVTPAFPQGNENNDWQAIEDQRDARRKAELLDSFIKKYPTSGRRPDADFTLVDFYSENKDYQKILQMAEEFRQRPPSADPATKSKMFVSAMFAAASLNDIKRTVEYGDYALAADPNNFAVLYFFAAANLPNPAKGLEYGKKAIALPKPANIRPEVYATQMGRLHGIVAAPLFAEGKFAEAREHLEAALKANPKDQATQFRLAFANVNLMGAAAKAAQDANTALIKAMSATPPNNSEADAAKAKMESSSKEALELRDVAIESLARAIAIGGQFTQDAQKLFDGLYQAKNKSLDGATDLVAQKKSELGL
jgi:tetratricopeptide (TPR) repeat protein